MLERIRTLTPLPVKWYVMGSDHGDHTAGNGELPAGVRYFVHPASRAQLVRDSIAGTAASPVRRVIVPPTAMSGSRDSVDIGGLRAEAEQVCGDAETTRRNTALIAGGIAVTVAFAASTWPSRRLTGEELGPIR